MNGTKQDPDVVFYLCGITSLENIYSSPEELIKGFPLKTSQFKSSKDDQESYSNLKFKLSIICFSETWETDYDISKNYSFQLEGYNATHQVRKKSQRERDSSVCKQSS